MEGLRFGRLLVVTQVPAKTGRAKRWLCLCDCGNQKEVDGISLRAGRTGSCGCAQREGTSRRMRTHGGHRSPTYLVWGSMIQRCHNENAPNYRLYGGRGIHVCERWRGVGGYANFLADMGERPSKAHSLDRYPDKDGGYHPANCRWVTQREQMNNTRVNRILEYEGKQYTVAQLARHFGVADSVFRARIRNGWSIERASSKNLFR